MSIETKDEVLISDIIQLSKDVSSKIISDNRDYKLEKILREVIKDVISKDKEVVLSCVKKINKELDAKNQYIIDNLIKEVVQVKTSRGKTKILFSIPFVLMGVRVKNNGKTPANTFYDNSIKSSIEKLIEIIEKIVKQDCKVEIFDRLVDYSAFVGKWKRLYDLLNNKNIDNGDSILNSNIEMDLIEDEYYTLDVLKYIVGSISISDSNVDKEAILIALNNYNKYASDLMGILDIHLESQNLSCESNMVLAPSLVTSALENGYRSYNYQVNYEHLSNIRHFKEDFTKVIGNIEVDTLRSIIIVSLCSKSNNKEIFSFVIDYPIKSFESELIDLSNIFDTMSIDFKISFKDLSSE